MLIPAACGALGMSPRTFVPLVVLAGTVWAVPVAFLAYSAGGAMASAIVALRHHEVLLAAALVLVPAGYVGARRLRRAVRRHDLGLADLHDVVPFAVGLMGVLNLVSAIVPRAPESMVKLEQWLPLEVMQRSRPPMLFAGLALIQVTRSLARRKELAWWIASIALAMSLVLHVGRAFDLHHSLVAGLLLLYLVVFRRRFYARSDPPRCRRPCAWRPSWPRPCSSRLRRPGGDARRLRVGRRGHAALEPIRSGILILDAQVDPANEHAARAASRSRSRAGWPGSAC
jgi:hypothetical protein